MPGLFDAPMRTLDPSMIQPLPGFPSQTDKKKSRLSGLLDRISSGATRARDTLMPSPTGMEGLLSDGDVRNARSQGLIGMGVGLLNSKGGGLAPIADGISGAQSAYGNSLMGTLEQRSMGNELRQSQDIMQKKQELAARYPVGPNMTADQMREVYMAYMQAGVPVPGGLSEIIKTMEEKPPRPPIQIHAGGKTIVRDPLGIKPDEIISHTPTPRNPGEMSEAQMGAQFQRDYQREQGLGDDFDKQTRPFREISNRIDGALKETDRAMAGDGAAQVNMLYAFVSAMDPTSVVREGEISLIRSAAPFFAQAQALIGKYTQGDRSFAVPPEMIRQMAGLMQRRKSGIDSFVGERGRYFAGRAKKWGVDPSVFEVGGADFSDVTSGSPKGNAGNVRKFLKK